MTERLRILIHISNYFQLWKLWKKRSPIRMSLTRACVYISIYRRLCFRFFLAFLVGTPPSTYLRVCMSVYSLACLGLGTLLCIPLHVLSCFPALWFAHPFCFFVFLFSPSFFPFFSFFFMFFLFVSPYILFSSDWFHFFLLEVCGALEL